MPLRTALLSLTLLGAVATQSQPANIYVDGESYLAIDHPDYASRTDFHELSTQASGSGYPIESYWFVRADDAHVIVHVANGGTVFFLELSGTKPVYNFPADYRAERGGANDVDLLITDKAGQERELSLAGNAHLTVRIAQRDALHLALSFDGALVSSPGPASLVPVMGTISLAKHDAALARLPDAYAGCDNTIYNTMSPHDDLGQSRSATVCEANFHHKAWSTIDKALQPAYRYLQSQHWVCDGIKENQSEWIYREKEHQLFSYTQFGGEKLTGSCQPDPSVAMQIIPLSRIEELSARLSALPLDPPPQDRARVEKEREAIQKELTEIGSGLTGKHQLFLEVELNEPSVEDYPIDIAGGSIAKVSDSEYLVENTSSPQWGYNNAGGTYLLLGHWHAPERIGDRVSFAPDPPSGARPLSVQAVLLRIGGGDALAKEVRRHLDLDALRQLLQIMP